MWNEKSSSSAIAAIGDATRDDEEREAEREERDPPAGTGWPRRASVRARTP